jgi:glycopeptide antibiotics resistance protein
MSTRLLLVLWIGVIAFVVVPWRGFQDHAHWNAIQWVPFLSPPFPIRDIILNAVLFIPFGYWYVQQPSGRGSIWRACAYGLALSIVLEFTQIFSHGRFPSATDVATNTLGALWGARWARKRPRG